MSPDRVTLRELTDANRDEPVGFVMLSWNCVPDPPEVFGPWFLWRLLIDARHQRHGYGRDVVPTGERDEEGEIIVRLDLGSR